MRAAWYNRVYRAPTCGGKERTDIKEQTDNFIADAVDKYSDTVFRIAFQYTRSRADAEDVVQDVFMRLLTKPPKVCGEQLKAWLIRVAINKSKDRLRAVKRRRRVLACEPVPPQGGEVFDELSLLPERDRNVLYLHYYEGYTAREIAEITGDSERAVTKRMGRAREKLRRYLED